jgi:hypothetical protein
MIGSLDGKSVRSDSAVYRVNQRAKEGIEIALKVTFFKFSVNADPLQIVTNFVDPPR